MFDELLNRIKRILSNINERTNNERLSNVDQLIRTVRFNSNVAMHIHY